MSGLAVISLYPAGEGRMALSNHDQIANFFSRRRNQYTAAKFRNARSQAFTTWAEATGVEMAA